MRVLPLTLAALLLAVTPASAVVVQRPDGGSPAQYQQWADASLVPTVPGVVNVRRADCPAWPGRSCAAADGRVYMAPRQILVRGTWLHELGHLFDWTFMSDSLRWRFRQLIHDGRAWHLDPRSHVSSPQERFADAYAVCAMYRQIPASFYGAVSFDYSPGPRTHRLVCSLIRRAAEGGA